MATKKTSPKRKAKAQRRQSKRTQVKTFTEEERAAIMLQLQADSPDVSAIAKENNMGEARLRKWAADAGLALPRAGGTAQSVIDSALAEVDARVDGQPSISEIAKKYGKTDQTIYAWINKRKAGKKAGKKASALRRGGRVNRAVAHVVRPLANGHSNGASPGSYKPPSQVPLALIQVEALLETSLEGVRQAQTALTAFWAAFGGGEPNGNSNRTRQGPGVGRHPRG
jgi:transposase-like protein